ncbi:MAG: hypothetical protein HIU82_20760 [Proteobacteria bacterium]|nr:hypothetical protein [Pseudomonadota bacterium]
MRRPRRASLRRALQLGAALPALAALTGCGPGRDQFAPACPIARPLPEAEHLLRYRNSGRAGGPGPADLVLDGTVIGAGGKCRRGDKKGSLAATLRVQMQLTRGPAAPASGIDVPYFVAVAQGKRVLSKQVFATHIAFPADQPRVQFTSAPIAITLPVASNESGAAYTIWVGFQLTPGEFAAEGAR